MEGLEHIFLKCQILGLALEQRAHEAERGIGKEGTKGYEERGCYDCDGYNTKCPLYFPPKGKPIQIDYEDDSKFIRGYN